MMSNNLNTVIVDRPSKCTWKANVTNSPHLPIQETSLDRKKILPNILGAIGQTPLVRLNKILKLHEIKCEILVKCEFMNPGGSIKDRIGLNMIKQAEENGKLKPGSTIIEPTAGNTGIGLALTAALRGYKCICVMPYYISNEKEDILRALGAEVVRTPKEDTFKVVEKLLEEIPNSVLLLQFTNPGNPLVHYYQTAMEILEQTEGKIDYFFGAAGTGGTLTGIGRKFRELSPKTKIIGVDPEGSIIADPPEINESNCKSWEIEGMGHPYIPTTLDKSVVDLWMKVKDQEAFLTARSLSREEGLLVGGSSGAILAGALKFAKDLPEDKRIVVILPDGIQNYLTKFVSDHWMESKGYLITPEPIDKNRWWWTLSVSEIGLLAHNLVAFSKETICEEAMQILEKKNLQQAPIVNCENKIIGSVYLKDIISSLISGRAEKNDHLERIIIERFVALDSETTLGRISRILEKENFVAIVDQETKLLGMLTQKDLLKFITNRHIKTLS